MAVGRGSIKLGAVKAECVAMLSESTKNLISQLNTSQNRIIELLEQIEINTSQQMIREDKGG